MYPVTSLHTCSGTIICLARHLHLYMASRCGQNSFVVLRVKIRLLYWVQTHLLFYKYQSLYQQSWGLSLVAWTILRYRPQGELLSSRQSNGTTRNASTPNTTLVHSAQRILYPQSFPIWVGQQLCSDSYTQSQSSNTNTLSVQRTSFHLILEYGSGISTLFFYFIFLALLYQPLDHSTEHDRYFKQAQERNTISHDMYHA